MSVHDDINELRFEGYGSCAVCGEDAPNVKYAGLAFSRKYSVIYDELKESVVEFDYPQMLCPYHQDQWRYNHRDVSFREWIETHEDAHWFYHVVDVVCPDCIYCTGCEENFPMEHDYFCERCRYGS